MGREGGGPPTPRDELAGEAGLALDAVREGGEERGREGGEAVCSGMDESKQVFIGTDCGATMSKVGGVWADGTTISTKLHQRPTASEQGRAAVVAGWIAGCRRISARRTS